MKKSVLISVSKIVRKTDKEICYQNSDSYVRRVFKSWGSEVTKTKQVESSMFLYDEGNDQLTYFAPQRKRYSKGGKVRTDLTLDGIQYRITGFGLI